MTHSPIRVGLIGAGANMRARHIPGLTPISGVEIVAVCNRRPESTTAVAREFGIPKTSEHWRDIVVDPDIDAVVIGAWPYLHCPVTLAALEAGKHVLTEARMSLNAAEAHRMLAASRRNPKLVAQIVPSPYGLKAHDVMRDLMQNGYLGDLREVSVYHFGGALADPVAPLSWRQDAALSGFNMLTLGILHETLLRWAMPTVRVLAQVHAFIPTRIDPASGVRRPTGTPDSVQVLTIMEDGARGVYQLSGVTAHGQGMGLHFYGSEGYLHYDLVSDRIFGLNKNSRTSEPEEIPIPQEKARSWQVEADFIDAIRNGKKIELTDFETGVAYMEFTEAVARSARRGEAVTLPLADFAS
ncbi:MAG: Gfo/Idh/MocA family protein [Gemmataceae bacterium]